MHGGVEARDKSGGGVRAIGSNVVIDTVQIRTGRVSNNELAATAGDDGPPVSAALASRRLRHGLLELRDLGLASSNFSTGNNILGQVATIAHDRDTACRYGGVALIDQAAEVAEVELILFQQSQTSADDFAGITEFAGLHLGRDERVILGGQRNCFAVLHGDHLM